MDKVLGLDVVNKFNPGGIEATLKRWYEDPEQVGRWVVFDGVQVSLRDRLDNLREGEQSICLTEELASVVGDNAHLTLREFLYNDF